MAVREIVLQVPEELYEQLRRKAEASQQTFSDVALHSLRVGMPPALDHIPRRFHADLQSLDQMSDGLLRQVAQADLPDDKAALYESLLEKNQVESLSGVEQEMLDTLREEADLLMFRRAYAYTLLKWRGQPPTPSLETMSS
jgi:hypothetical protein